MPASAITSRRVAVEVETVELSALLSVADCCALLGGLNSKTVMGYIRSGELPAIALGANGGKPFGVEVADLMAFKAARRVRPEAVVVELASEAAGVEEEIERVPEAASRKGAGWRASGSRRRRASTNLIAA
jgi:hypothetical protein